MKKFKELVEKLQELIVEREDTPGGGFGRSAHSHYGIHRVEDDEQIGRVNSFLNTYSTKETLDPRSTLYKIRHKMNTMGLDFTFSPKDELNLEGMNQFSVTRSGGTFGKSLDTPFDEFETTDGMPDGISMTLNAIVETMPSGMYAMKVRLEKGM